MTIRVETIFPGQKINGRYVRNDVCPAAHVLRPCLYISDIKKNTRKLSAHFLSPRKTGLSSLKNRLTKSINFIFTRALLVCVYIYIFFFSRHVLRQMCDGNNLVSQSPLERDTEKFGSRSSRLGHVCWRLVIIDLTGKRPRWFPLTKIAQQHPHFLGRTNAEREFSSARTAK